MHEPADLKGLKIRTLPNPVITECLRLMGAAATPLAFGEIYTALQAGVLDGLEHDPPTILASKFYETVKFYSLTQHNFSPLATYFSDATFRRMDPKLRDGFLDAAGKAAVDTRAHGLAVEQDALGVLKSKGVTVLETDREAFRQAHAAADRRLREGAPGRQGDRRYDPRNHGLTTEKGRAQPGRTDPNQGHSLQVGATGSQSRLRPAKMSTNLV